MPKLLLKTILVLIFVTLSFSVFAQEHFYQHVNRIIISHHDSVDSLDNKQVYYLPVVGWNNYNRWMPGVLVYSNPLLKKKLDYCVMPMYSITTATFTGGWNIGYTINPNNTFQSIRIGLIGKQYNYDAIHQYRKLAPEIVMNFAQSTKKNTVDSYIKFRIHAIQKEFTNYRLNDERWEPFERDFGYYVNELYWSYSDKRIINPFRVRVSAQQAKQMLKSSFECNYTLTYPKKKKGIEIRFFAGKFLMTPDNPNVDYRFRLSGNMPHQDYLYDNNYLGRTEYEGILSQQMYQGDGNFKFHTVHGQTWNWLSVVNLNVPFPEKLPISLFCDIGAYGYSTNNNSMSEGVLFDAGVKVSIINDIFEVYFPFAMSGDMAETAELRYDSYIEKIRFTLNLNKMNPLEIIEDTRNK